MRNRSWLISLIVVAASSLAPGVVVATSARSKDVAEKATPAPFDYIARVDGSLKSVAGADGRLWATWSYRAAGESDIAVAVRGIDGVWGPTVFFGRFDRIDQVDPAIVADASGTIYLAFATRIPGRVFLAILPPGATTWRIPEVVSSDQSVSTPTLALVRDRVVVAYRTPRGIRLLDLPAFVPPPETQGIHDGPDGIDPLGNSGDPGGSGSPGHGGGPTDGGGPSDGGGLPGGGDDDQSEPK